MEKQEDNNGYKEKYEALQAEYQSFAYIVSHDLQSPIRQMTGFIDILLHELDMELNEEQTCYYDLIKNAGEEASEAINALLEFSRFNTIEKNIVDLDLKEIATNALEDLQTDNAQIAINDMPHAKADAELMQQFFSHILANAIKFKNSERALSIEIGVQEENNQVWYYIKDNGIGMKPDKIPTALSLFRQLNAPEDYPGQGIGLTYAKKIIDVHGGNLKIETAPDEGTAIFFALP